MIFDSYAQFEESLISNLMDLTIIRSEKTMKDDDTDLDLDICMMRFEQLMDRRPFLINDVLLRQNPNNIVEWEKRAGLWGSNKDQIIPDLHQCRLRLYILGEQLANFMDFG